jgi:maltokinase
MSDHIPDEPTLTAALRGWLPRQRWYSGTKEPVSLRVVDRHTVRQGPPALLRFVLDADGILYHVLVGVRQRDEPLEFLRAQERAVIVETGASVSYDAVVDPELALAVLAEVAPGEAAQRPRLVTGEQSNTSIVYDERLILKVFRRLQPGPNPEVEITTALADVGFQCVAAPRGVWRSAGYDFAVLQPFLAGAVEGWALALTSLRDLFGMHDTSSIPAINLDAPPPTADPAQAGGDFSGEAYRLGEMTARMHVALAEAFGQQPGDARAWAQLIRSQLDAIGPHDLDRKGADALVGALADADPGPAIRVHGDYHLGQVLRTDTGWYVLDFEGEPARPVEERRRQASPLRDVAGMLRSFHYASAVARTERDAEELDELGAAWERRNRDAFLDGYVPPASNGGVLPRDPGSVETVLSAFELEKAVYELRYERNYRPDWEAIPLAALRRLTAAR